MKNLTKETWQILKLNIKNVLIFEFLFRLAVLPVFLRFINEGLKLALKLSGYSYVTAGNIGTLLLKPWTAVYLTVSLFFFLLILMVECGALITSFQYAAYSRKAGVLDMLSGGLEKLRDETVRRNWQLPAVVLLNFVLSHLFLINRIILHIRPLNYVLTGLMESRMLRFVLLFILVLLTLGMKETLFICHGCMIEQKSFRDSLRRSRQLVGGRVLQAMGLQLFWNLTILTVMILTNVVCVVTAAICILYFARRNLALAVLTMTADRIELTVLFFGGAFLTMVNYASLTVQYYQYRNRLNHEPRWDFSYWVKKRWNKKKKAAAAVGMGILAAIYIFDLSANGFLLADSLLSETQVTAHRGSSRTAPENTMEAVEAAVDELADYVELDVQETEDGRLVLFHDGTLKRVAGLNRTIASFTWEELKDVDVGSWFSENYEGVRIPSLEEVLEKCGGRIKFNIELKNLGRNSRLPEKVADLVHEANLEEQCVISSTNLSYLRRVKERRPELKTGYILSAAYGNYYSDQAVDFISIRSGFIDKKLVDAVHEEGKEVHAWTVNSKMELERMKLLGVDNIITDVPVFAREVLFEEEGAKSLLEYLRLVLKQ